MISIIIPVLNEESSIIELLQHLQNNAVNASSMEIIVVDGGSKDATLQKVKNFKSHYKTTIKVVHSEKGRGTQLHNGSKEATQHILYFLHADSYPPKNYDQLIINAVDNGHPAGCFRMKFKSWHPWLIIIGWFTRFSWKASRGGDQSQYITRKLYDDIGGYNTQIPIYEDYDIIARLYGRDQYYVIPKWLKTSARRYHEKGVLRLQWFYITIYWRKYRGATIDELYQYYLSKCD
ncbi:rSAM/selenodomain-associated transferase 2 [Nonlabens dokdonensis]|jgi:rSAM/selenodomain-associated transferase 2|uniref:Glycosyl transferase, family 2 n=2 Tax=Nonlabens dokdonensis TaxID=328515 RepID=L7W9X2_NONDD|nr:TIGR04283 family arsenosugar biosynthesis glycosyltransferase [Nonlabens dokdonensis]AGC77027.1 glycosyl transferase, family 2 [Nonlabens dokdonensis DSW-6]PZX40989.1 rSAM/selenodomain-associated transferase 2 [Nonlabens dokdonensis]